MMDSAPVSLSPSGAPSPVLNVLTTRRRGPGRRSRRAVARAPWRPTSIVSKLVAAEPGRFALIVRGEAPIK